MHSSRSDSDSVSNRAVRRYYALLDTGTVRSTQGYAGDVAAHTVSHEFDVPIKLLWQWIRETTA